MKEPVLYRKRLIPEECILLKDDKLLYFENDILVTKWLAIKPKKDLHHGYSCYFLKEGYKISKFYTADNTLLYYYCDIISHEYDSSENKLVVTDLLADVIVYPDGFIKVVDLDEIPAALDLGRLSLPDLKKALLSCNALLSLLYHNGLPKLLQYIEQFEER